MDDEVGGLADFGVPGINFIKLFVSVIDSYAVFSRLFGTGEPLKTGTYPRGGCSKVAPLR